jgi:hypothetical protein
MAAEFRARADYQNFTRVPLKAGDTLRITSFVHDDIGPDGRLRTSASAATATAEEPTADLPARLLLTFGGTKADKS